VTEPDGAKAKVRGPSPLPVPTAATIAACALAGFALPWLSPVTWVRQCPEELRYSFPLLFAIDRPHADGSTLLLGVAVNTIVWTLVLLVVIVGIGRFPRLASAAAMLRRNRRNVLSLLAPAVVLIVLAGFESPTLTTAIGPGHVGTPACWHVSGHTRRSNWWGPDRFELLNLDRLLP